MANKTFFFKKFTNGLNLLSIIPYSSTLDSCCSNYQIFPYPCDNPLLLDIGCLFCYPYLSCVQFLLYVIWGYHITDEKEANNFFHDTALLDSHTVSLCHAFEAR